MIEWIKSRAQEPSTWAAVGAVLIGLGILVNTITISIIGIVVAVLGFVLKEKGVL
jgi:hypothetical protein|tara:strand:+ start:214 stop:378 length:165 start_codon:yes stop_codon:yes gene_type:complete